MKPAPNKPGLLFSSILYGAGDVLVLAVGGLLLLPLYTRALSQEQFGTYVVVKTNAELFTYLLYFGLPSAAARLYFDYRRTGQHLRYMSSVVMLFALNMLVFCGVCYFWGADLWRFLSPEAPPGYLWVAVAIAAVGFYGSLGPLWLRLDERVYAFVGLQILSAVVLVAAAVFCLIVLHLGVRGVFIALLASSACAATALPVLFGRAFRPVMRMEHVLESLRFAAPVACSYAAYFLLNRVGTLILQHHVPVARIAVFGLAQQLAMLVTIAGASFGKAVQPAVFGAAPEEAMRVLRRTGELFVLAMFAVTSLLMLFGPELFTWMAPRRYESGYEVLLVLAWGNLAYSFNLIANTALIQARRPNTAVLTTAVGAGLSVLLSWWLIPAFELPGAAFAMAGSFFATTLVGQWLARDAAGHSHLRSMLLALAAAAVVGLLAQWLSDRELSEMSVLGLKMVPALVIVAVLWLVSGVGSRGRLWNR